MESILARRYAFCDFSHIAGFPNLVPDRGMWEYCLPRFSGNDFDHPAEHLFDFHECMHRMNILHEDVLIKMFRNSLEGKAREWCNILPAASITSLSDFHTVFYSHYRGKYSTEFSFENCCEIFKSYHQRKMEISSCYVDKKELDVEGVEEFSLEKCDTHVQEDHANPFLDQPVYDMHKPIPSIEEIHGEIQSIQDVDVETKHILAPFSTVKAEGSFINGAEITEQEISCMYQLSKLHAFHDPVDDYMKLFFTKDINIAEMSMQLRYNCQFEIFIQILPHISLYFCTPLFYCKQPDNGVSHMIERLFWKSVYT